MKITPKLLASIVGGSVEGDENTEILGFAKIEEAKPGEISFIANPKYEHFIDTTPATVLLVSNDFAHEIPEGKTLIRVADPYMALATLLNAFESQKPRQKGIEQPCFIAEGVAVPDDCYIGAFSYIGAGAKIGAGAMIYPQAYVGQGVEIGDNTVIRQGAKIYEGCQIGKNCTIHAGAVIGADGFGFAPTPDGSYEKIPQIGIVVIEDNVEIGANTTVDRATFGCTRVGKGTKLDNLIQIAHNVELGQNNVFAAQTGVAGSTKIGSGNRVGGQVGFAGHIRVGDHNEFGAQSGINSRVGDHKRLIGYPAVPLMTFAKTQVYLKRLGELFDKEKKD